MKILLAILIFLSLVFGGGVASRTVIESWTREEPEDLIPRLFAQAGVQERPESFEHIFLTLKAPETSGDQSLVITHLADGIWVAAPQPEERASFTAMVLDETEVILEGTVDSSETADLLEEAARNAAGIKSVRSKLAADETIAPPPWKENGPRFLGQFLSVSGAKQMAVNREGVRLEGEVISRSVREKLGELAREIAPAPKSIHNDLSVKAPLHPALAVRTAEPGQIEMSGLLPREDVRSSISAALKTVPGVEVIDLTKIDDGVSEAWWAESAPVFLPFFFSKLQGAGSVEFSKDQLLLSGQAKGPTEAAGLADRARELGRADKVAVVNHLSLAPTEEPELAIEEDAFGNLVLEGKVAARAIKDQILASLLKLDPDAVLLDRLDVSDRVRDAGWEDPGQLAAELLARAKNHTPKKVRKRILSASDRPRSALEASLPEAVLHSAPKNAEAASAALLPNTENAPSMADLHPAPAGDSNPEAEEANETGEGLSNKTAPPFQGLTVYFGRGSSRIKETDLARLRELSDEIKKLGAVTFTVGGYSDRLGSNDSNRSLSMKRARAVRDELIRLGIPSNQFKLQYFGEDKSNTNSLDLWKGRRVELSLGSCAAPSNP